jgi:3-phenylpropionate/cinnamic acid dioxygenase small subunit
MNSMNGLEQWRNEVEQLISENFFRVDSGHAQQGLELVSDDFTLELPNMTIDRAQYAGVMAKREEATYSTRHCFSNLRLMEKTDAGVRVAFVVTAHRLEEDAVDTTVTVADFSDHWVLKDDAWSLQSRSIRLVFPIGIGA